MIDKSIRYVAIIASAFVVVSFGLFAIDETREASATTRADIADSGPNRDPEEETVVKKVQAREHSEVRRAIDDVNEQITSPFAGIVSTDQNIWVQRGVPALLALLCFGVGLSFLARYTQGRAASVRPAR